MTGDQGNETSGGEAETEREGGTHREADSERFTHDPEKIRVLREVADEIRADDPRAEQLAAILYRVSDLYDPDEEASPADIHRNVKTILGIKERGTLARNPGSREGAAESDDEGTGDQDEDDIPGYDELEDLGVE